MKIQVFAAVMLASALAAPAQAADRDFSERVFAVMADTIAEQGNHALRDIRNEVRRNLVNTLKPLLPEPSNDADAGAETDTAAAGSAVQ
ncbi:MAG TPA: hypothetical protein VHE37_04480 [Nevskiaceae bacterium]|nr:hypothetical protein [Nevskiaceae bacterium]